MKAIVLRRNSWLVFFGVLILGLGIGMLAAIWKVTAVNGFRMGWQGVPVYLAFAGFFGRLASCKVVLREQTLLVVNPVRTYVIPKSAIQDVSVGDDGTLEVWVSEEQEISVFAFGGSLVDRFKGTSRKAEQRIKCWLSPGLIAGGTEAAPRVSWTRCAPADLSFALCVAIAGTGVIWMAITGG
ncbi:hypothetical protein [Streptomyces iconiensis]|uniref:PH domain-containing protein n=1 Tax=Streptomyces iconiensis TaxID=1384038 RepID=A0ABT7A693_9ACTN|nr:hypothetical protein [Streptomyces iconiensis]MDJ1136865.1 hypothetical protein [Streptomyces iconiensis]